MILKQLMARALAGHHGTVNLLLLLKWLQQQREAGFGQVCIACCSFCFPGAAAGEKSKGEDVQVSVAEWCSAWLPELPRCCFTEHKGSSSHTGIHPSGLEQAQPWAGASAPLCPHTALSSAVPGTAGRQQLSALSGPSPHPCWSTGSEFPLPSL